LIYLNLGRLNDKTSLPKPSRPSPLNPAKTETVSVGKKADAGSASQTLALCPLPPPLPYLAGHSPCAVFGQFSDFHEQEFRKEEVRRRQFQTDERIPNVGRPRHLAGRILSGGIRVVGERLDDHRRQATAIEHWFDSTHGKGALTRLLNAG
jgi:hypothetical protein